jgi:superfamily II DNA/RNA helicase
MLQTDKEEGGLQGEKVMVFLNSVEDVEAVHQALEQRDIDAVPYHAKISLQDRSKNLEKFRFYNNGSDTNIAKATVPVLVCTDLASRGLDVPGVTAVVQLQFSGNVVSHLHRMGRCGRAGQRTGRGIVFYSEEEKDLVEVVKEAEEQQERMDLKQDVDDRDEDGNMEEIGKVKKAFSRKRGFTKKRKKLKREGEVA